MTWSHRQSSDLWSHPRPRDDLGDDGRQPAASARGDGVRAGGAVEAAAEDGRHPPPLDVLLLPHLQVKFALLTLSVKHGMEGTKQQLVDGSVTLLLRFSPFS